MNNQKKTTKLAKMGMLSGIAIILVAIIHIPIIPSVPFLEYDPADIPILLGTFAFGPVSGILLTIVTAILQGLTVSSQSGFYGIIMHIIATGVFSLCCGIIYNYKDKKTKKHAIIGLIVGSIMMTIVMIFANLLITPYFMGTTVTVVKGLLPGIILFNLLKAGINSLITMLIYKRVSPFLHK